LNQLRVVRRQNAWRILARQFESIIVHLLLAASVVSLIYGERLDAIGIAVVIVINAGIGFATEYQAVRSIEALARLSITQARVRRDGSVRVIEAQDLVPGDIVVLEAGDVVSADIRIVEASKLQADESTLTGESEPVTKHSDPVSPDASLPDRRSMLFNGTAITRGSGAGVVVATGMATQLGEISALVEEADQGRTPLERRLEQLGRGLLWLTLGIATVVSIIGILAGRGILMMFQTGVALAVAAIPEGLPIVATITLAHGVWRMARRNAVVRRLSAVETLGATSVILMDKTGTLTENLMSVTELWLPSGRVAVRPANDGVPFLLEGNPIKASQGPALQEALELGVLCNNASLGDGDSPTTGASGEPVEIALLAAAASAGMRRADLAGFAEEREEAFDPEVKMMATYHVLPAGYRVAVKGAPEAVLAHCDSLWLPGRSTELTGAERQTWLKRSSEMAEKGLRVLALATKNSPTIQEEPYQGLALVGLAGMHDPPREGVRNVVTSFHRAGVRVVMATGDHAATAASITAAIGLTDGNAVKVVEGWQLEEDRAVPRPLVESASVFARVSPKQKLNLIRMFQEWGAVVAMMGDGVNDAPALRKADIGIAMGRRGTEVAREAADMVLRDDALETVVTAIEEGRVIFNNIRTFVLYLLSCNLSEVLSVGLAAATTFPLPVLPLQILFLNLLTDVFPALALGMNKGGRDVMREPPRLAGEPILTRRMWWAAAGGGMVLTAAVLGSFAIALYGFKAGRDAAVTISFLTLAITQLLHVFNMAPHASIFKNPVTRNPYVWLALAVCGGILLTVLHTPVLAEILRIAPLDRRGWTVVATMSSAPVVVVQFFRALKRLGRRPR
jgi:Ca2+-transporting ATPase